MSGPDASGPDAAGPGGSGPEARLDRIEARLAAARAALENGGLSDLDGLESEVTALRDGAAALPADAAARLRPRLLAVLDEIDRLSEAFREGLTRLGQELGETGRRRRAVSAYHQGQSHKGSGNKGPGHEPGDGR